MTVNKDGWDQKLWPFLDAANPRDEGRQFDKLANDILRPIVEGIVRQKLRRSAASDSDDVIGEILSNLILALRSAKSSHTPVNNLEAYAVRAAQYGVAQYLRDRFPNWHRMKDAIRYLLKSREKFALWTDGSGKAVCGLAAWRGLQQESVPIFDWNALACDLDRDFPSARSSFSTSRDNSAEFVPIIEAVFARAGAPMRLDTLVRICAHLSGVKDAPDESLSDDDGLAAFHANSISLSRLVVGKLEVRRLWGLILRLPIPERIALLLQSKDEKGNSVIQLLELEGVATLSEIARLLEISARSFAELWEDIPLKDEAIARKFGRTIQAVREARMRARLKLEQVMGSD